jgi:hypothetical protein
MNIPHQSPPVVRADNKDARDARGIHPQGEGCECDTSTNTWWCWFGRDHVNTGYPCETAKPF